MNEQTNFAGMKMNASSAEETSDCQMCAHTHTNRTQC